MHATTTSTELYRVRKRTPSRAVRSSKRLKQLEQEKNTGNVNCLPSPQSEQHILSKRKRVSDFDHSSEPPHKNACLQRTTAPSDSIGATLDCNLYGSEVDWGDYFGTWPPKMSDPRTNKRKQTPVRSNSYSQSVRDGESPAAWTRQHEEKMAEAGLFMMDHRNPVAITDNCQKLCDTLLKANFPLPEEPSFQAERLSDVLARVRFRNEFRVVRDVTPVLVPSPELLHIDQRARLDNIGEAINAEWTQCDTLCGPRPKPDAAIADQACYFLVFCRHTKPALLVLAIAAFMLRRESSAITLTAPPVMLPLYLPFAFFLAAPDRLHHPISPGNIEIRNILVHFQPLTSNTVSVKTQVNLQLVRRGKRDHLASQIPLEVRVSWHMRK